MAGRTTGIGGMLRRASSLDLYRIASGTIGDTTLSGSLAKAASTVPVTAITNFTAGDPAFIIGSYLELVTIGTPNTTMPITNQKIEFTAAAGDRFVEAVRVPLGKLSKGQTKMNVTKSTTPVFSDVDDLPITYLDGQTEISVSFGLYDFSALNVRLALGLKDQSSGAETSSDPEQSSVGGQSAVSTPEPYIVFRYTGLDADGKTIVMDFLNARMESSGDIPLDGRDAPTSISMTAKVSQWISRRWV